MISVHYSDLLQAFEFVSFGSPYSHSAYISRATGEIFWESELMEEDEELPEDIGDPDKYITLPHKNEFDLGKRLVLRFCAGELSDEDYDKVEDIFTRKGAYARYKNLLESRGLLEAWYKYEEAETEAALREWAEEEGLKIVETADEPPA